MSLGRRHHRESNNQEEVGGVLASQLNLELQLRENCQELLHSYKETQNWAAVEQTAQTLVTNTARITELKQLLEDSVTRLPYLEKILESDSEARSSRSPELVEGEKSVQDIFLADGQDKRFKLEKTEPCLSNIIDINSEKCSSRDNCQERDISSDTEQYWPVLDDPQFLNSASPLIDSDLKETVHSALLVASPSPTHPDPLTIGVKREGVSGIDELDKITGMEPLASKLYEDGKVQPPVEQRDSVATENKRDENVELTVPFNSRYTDVSSESSEQFYSPRDSLYFETGGSDGDDKETERFEDEESHLTQGSLMQNETKFDSIFSIRRILMNGSSEGEELDCYYIIESDFEASSKIFDDRLSPVVHSYSDFIQLQKQLNSYLEDSSVLHLEPHSQNGNHPPKDASKDLERFLNQIAFSLVFRKTPVFISFLKNSDHRWCSDDIQSEALSQGMFTFNVGTLCGLPPFCEGTHHEVIGDEWYETLPKSWDCVWLCYRHIL